jgi:hypothetical protein
LTLTNEGGGLLQITNIEWEYMTYYFPPGEESRLPSTSAM